MSDRMTPQDVPADLVEAASRARWEALGSVFTGCNGDVAHTWNALAALFPAEAARRRTNERHTLAAVYGEIQARALEEAADPWQEVSGDSDTPMVSPAVADWLHLRAARLRTPDARAREVLTMSDVRETLREIRERAEAAGAELDRLCQDRTNWRWSIPANPERDSDLIIAASQADVSRVARALEAVLEVHRPGAPECAWGVPLDQCRCPSPVRFCDACGDPAPCTTVRAITDALTTEEPR